MGWQGDKVPEELKTEIEEKMKALKDILESGSKEEIDSKSSELSTSLQKIGEHMSKQSAESAPTDAAADGAQSESAETVGDEKKADVEEGEVVN